MGYVSLLKKKNGHLSYSRALGSSVYKHLVELLPPDQVVLISRHPDKTPEALAGACVQVRKADSLSQMLSMGVSSLSYLISEHRNRAPLFGRSPCILGSFSSVMIVLLLINFRSKAHQSAITAALQGNPGIEHVFYTSLRFAGDSLPQSAAHVMQGHLRTEACLRPLARKEPDLTFTIIREGIYSESFPMYTAFFDPRDTAHEVLVSHDGTAPGIAWVEINDPGEACANLVQDFVDDPQN